MIGAYGWQPSIATLDQYDFDSVAIEVIAKGRADGIEPVIDELVYGTSDNVGNMLWVVFAIVVLFSVSEVVVDGVELGDILFGEAVDDVLDVRCFLCGLVGFRDALRRFGPKPRGLIRRFYRIPSSMKCWVRASWRPHDNACLGLATASSGSMMLAGASQ